MIATPDGYTSASMIVSYIQNNHKKLNVRYLLHSGRQHGLTPVIMKSLNERLPDILILPDSSSGNFEEHAELKSKGVDVLVLDHHNVERESLDAVVVSNHPVISPDYNNTELSGAAIALKFIEALDEFYGTNESVKYYSHAALGIVADMMSLLHGETRYYVYEGLKNIKNPLIKHFIYKNAYHAMNEAYPKIVSWNISNYMNATIRMGSQEDKTLMFEGLLGKKQTLTRTSKYRGVEREITEELHETVYRLCSNARQRQNTAKRKLIQEAVQYVEENNLSNNAVIVVLMEKLPDGFSGFLAADVSKIYKRPTLVMSWNKSLKAYTGSGRGIDSVMLDTRKFVEDLGVFNFSSGHNQAFGVSIDKDNIDGLNDLINGKMKVESIPLEVDFEIDVKALSESLIREFDSYDYLWCSGFEEPLVAIKNVEINCKNIVFGNVMKVVVGNVEYLAFQNDRELQELAEQGKIATCNIVGTLGVNRFLGNETLQVKMESIEVVSTKDVPAFGFEF